MTLILTIANTIMLVIVLGDRIKEYFKKATWDDKVLEAAKGILSQLKKEKGE